MSTSENKNETKASNLRAGCLSFLNNKAADTNIPCTAANRKMIVQVLKEGFTVANIIFPYQKGVKLYQNLPFLWLLSAFLLILLSMKSDITYSRERTLQADEFRDILHRSGLAERRPVNEPAKIESMLNYANLIVIARIGNKIIGVSRALSDFSFCTYLSDLAVDLEFQKKGIGKELIRQTKQYGGPAKLILLSAPGAINYYPKIGMKHFQHCYILNDVEEIT